MKQKSKLSQNSLKPIILMSIEYRMNQSVYNLLLNPKLKTSVKNRNKEYGVVHNLGLQEEVGDLKMSNFCQRSYHRKCKRREVGGQKNPKYWQRSL